MEKKGNLSESQESQGTILIKLMGLLNVLMKKKQRRETPASENKRENIIPWDFVFPDNKVGSSPVFYLWKRHVSRQKA